MALQRRLMQDIAELRTDPYPNIALHLVSYSCQKSQTTLFPARTEYRIQQSNNVIPLSEAQVRCA